MKKIKAITLLMAWFGFALIASAVSTMDYFLMELISDYPKYLNYLLYSGVFLMLPAVLHAILKGE